ncbi:hypothetical protein F511_24462 [Dorcoceras hygrometricum]|uniref:Uncharacterized protein n=1 Tax=Dorcoceras hygrometricum TaxID=472368 RepID=A0A2Z7AL25_9LAMI|nr:hypothetical protein F511_24462 [Dorcoceras hygrometricum]
MVQVRQLRSEREVKLESAAGCYCSPILIFSDYRRLISPTETRVVALDSSCQGDSSHTSFSGLGLAGGGSRRHLPYVVY